MILQIRGVSILAYLFYSRRYLLENGLKFDEALTRNEDVLFSRLCYSKATKIHFLPLTTYIMKEDPKGITKGMNILGTIENKEKFLNGAVIGANAVVISDVPPNSIANGVPAKIKERD